MHRPIVTAFRGGSWIRRSAACLAAALAFQAATAVVAVDVPPPGPEEAQRVFVADGVADDFDPVRAAIAAAERQGRHRYRVVVVDSPEAASVLLPELVDRWWQARGDQAGYDPARDVTILLNVGARSLAVDVPFATLESAGVDLEALERELILTTFVPRAKDMQYAAGLADLVAGLEKLVAERQAERIAAAERARTFKTRTLPIAAVSLVGAGLLGGLALGWMRHAARQRAARERLAAFKQEVVALSDMLDLERERHRMLPHADPDFRTPMQGMTLAAYEAVQAAIGRYRERWLGLMDVWERAQRRIGEERFLGTAASDEVIAMLDAADARPPLDEVAAACRSPLDALEQAHERARRLLTELEQDLAAARNRLDGLATRGRSAGPFEPVLAATARERELAAEDVERDPVAARGRLEEARGRLAAMTAAVDAVEAADDRRRQGEARGADIARRVAALRAEGWLLAEPGANPDAPLVTAAEEAGLAARLLDSGDAATAAGHLVAAETAAADAAALVESVIAARGRTEELLPAVVARLEAVAAAVPRARDDLDHLATRYADSAVADVADNVSKAGEGIERARILVAEARAAADPTRQHFLRAVAVLEEAVRQADWSAGCLEAITDRRAELDGLLAALPGRRDRVHDRVAALARSLERQRTDRARAHERCREAARLVTVAGGMLEERQPDPRRADHVVQAADTAAARGEELAAEDERLARQAVADVEEADATIRRIAGWYEEGVQADVAAAGSSLRSARSLVERLKYEEAIEAAGEASRQARLAYATATAEAQRRRAARQAELERRRLEESFARMSRGSGPWVISLPTGPLAGPDPWRSVERAVTGAAPSRPSAGGRWGREVAEVRW